MAHKHPCEFASKGCDNQVVCGGELVRNHDGHPSVICDWRHLPGGDIREEPCQECGDSLCADCGAVTRFENHHV
jgi:hypothetical protein